MRKGFIFDLNKCVGCEACVAACQIENGAEQSNAWRQISTYNAFQHPALPLFHFSLACNHCEDPLCLAGCPTGAYTMDELHHTVDHNDDLCIGCRYCTWMCPYDAPKFISAKGVVEKCTLCKERIVEGRKPNCANLCPTGALDFADIETGLTIDIPGFIDQNIRPGIKILPLRKKSPPIVAVPSLTAAESALYRALQIVDDRKVSLRSEWPLVLFTLLAATLFAIASAALFQPAVIGPTLFLVLGASGLLLSSVHLGKRLKAWRALLNVRTSWLSREIAAYLLFLISSALYMTVLPNDVVRSFSLLFGFITLISIDMVYVVVGRRRWASGQSASALSTGLLFFSLLGHLSGLFALLLAAKAMIYIRELLHSRTKSLPRLILSAIRITLGFILPLLLFNYQENIALTLVALLVAEAINRTEFYLDLKIITPRRQIEHDLLRDFGSVTTTNGR
jgi:Fe-S-cluster-containing dehydrogenase component